ncbi:hypothetical protein [Kitasatospora sp. McL0602]|uniref:hypothetical protein n=1 Tax=Kitasatospora sp. McL0602 TaxID=3439530 RepID=UPI003F888465
MSTNRSRRIDRVAAEQLLGGGKVGSSDGPAAIADNAALAGLLAAAAAAPAAGPDELPGEARALAAYRSARREPTPEPRRRTMAKTATGRAFSAKALLAALAITALGGVAVAAVKLPAVLSSPGANAPVAAPTAPGRTTASGPGAGRAPGTGGGSGSAGSHSGLDNRTATPGTVGRPSDGGQAHPSAGPDRSGSPDTPGQSGGTESPSPGSAAGLAKLCHSYQDREGDGTKDKQLLADPLLAPLVKAANGVEHVESYCNALVGKVKDHGGPATPSAPAAPSPEPPKGGGPKTPKAELSLPQLGHALTPASSAPPVPLQAPLSELLGGVPLDGVLVG